MTMQVPTSGLTTTDLAVLSGFDRERADRLDAAFAAGGASFRTVEYVATGTESPAGFTVPIPGVDMGSVDYDIGFLGVEADIIVPWAWSFPVASQTVNQFQARFAGDALTAGGVYKFILVEV